jgi:predicted Zn-dependent protease with MMP-like domain
MNAYDDLSAPSLADIDALARAGFAALPARFRDLCPDLVLTVEDMPDDDVLDELGAEDPFEITGLFTGVDLGQADGGASPSVPPTVTLFRRPILDEWADRGNVTLGELVRHVLVHEIAHYFGLSDTDIAAIDDWTA